MSTRAYLKKLPDYKNSELLGLISKTTKGAKTIVNVCASENYKGRRLDIHIPERMREVVYSPH